MTSTRCTIWIRDYLAEGKLILLYPVGLINNVGIQDFGLPDLPFRGQVPSYQFCAGPVGPDFSGKGCGLHRICEESTALVGGDLSSIAVAQAMSWIRQIEAGWAGLIEDTSSPTGGDCSEKRVNPPKTQKPRLL